MGPAQESIYEELRGIAEGVMGNVYGTDGDMDYESLMDDLKRVVYQE